MLDHEQRYAETRGQGFNALTVAVKGGRVQGFSASDITATRPALFEGTPGFVLVVPIALQGRVVAVVYADDSGRGPWGMEWV